MGLERTQKSTLILTSMLISYFVLIIRGSANDYSLSIYRQIPLVARVVFIIILILSVSGIIYSLFREDHITAILWAIPLLIQNALFFALVPLLGYHPSGPDFVSHISVMNEVLSSGTLIGEYRPSMYSLGAFLSVIGDIGAATSLYAVIVAAAVTFVFTVMVFARRLRIPAAAALPATVITLGFYPTPAAVTYSVFFVMVLYLLSLWLGNPDYRIYLIGLLFIFVMPSFHPLPTMLLFGSIMTALLLPGVSSQRDRLSVEVNGIKPTAGFTIISGVSLWVWLDSYQDIVGRATTIVVSGILGVQRPETRSTEAVTGTLFGQFGYSIWEFISIGIRVYGDIGLLIGIAILGLILYALSQRSDRLTTLHIIVLLVPPMAAAADFVIGIASGIGFIRLLRPSLYLAPIFVGAAIASSLEIRESHRTIAVVALLLVSLPLTGAIVLSTANHYDDPWTLTVNENRMDSDIEGASWLVEHKDHEMETLSLWRRFFRENGDLIEDRDERLDEFRNDRGEHRPPAHFAGEQQLGDAIENESYYIESRGERQFLLEGMPELDRLEPSDYDRLNSDPTVEKVYTNGNVRVRVIR